MNESVITKQKVIDGRKIAEKNIKSIFFAVILVLISLSDLFGISAFDYIDDIMAAFCFISVAFFSFYKKDVRYLLLLSGLFLTGFIGNLISGYNVSLKLIIEDYFFAFKHLFVAFYCLLCFPDINKKKTLKILNVYSKSLTILMFVVCLLQIMQGASKAGFYTSYSGYVGLYAFAFLLLNIYWHNKTKLKKVSLIIALLDVAIIIFSGSSTALFGVGLLIFFYFTWQLKRRGYPFMIPIILIIAVVLAFFVFEAKILGYFFNSYAPRSMMYREAIALANQYFPFGSGMGLFGGKIAADYYSPLYTGIGWNNIWVVREGSSYLLDTYFPTVLGEFGYLGCVLYITSLVMVGVKMIEVPKKNKIFSNYLNWIIYAFIIGTMLSFNCINSGLGISLVMMTELMHVKKRRTHGIFS